MTHISFIGLGTIGFPVAGHLANNGDTSVCVNNRTASKAEQWLEQYQGTSECTPKAAAKDADIVIICVGNDDDLRSVTLEENGIIHSIKPGAIVIDHTTASAQIARELATAFSEVQAHFIDAPVSGGQAGAEAGSLTIMCGGNQEIFDQVAPIMAHYSQSCLLMGEHGAGQLTKMVNQISAAGVIQGLAEGMAFAHNAGLDCEKVYAAISKGAAGSWQMQNRYQTMLQDHYEHGFAIDWMRKDLAICLEEAKHNGSELPMSELVDTLYARVQQQCGGRWDTSALIKALPHKRPDKS